MFEWKASDFRFLGLKSPCYMVIKQYLLILKRTILLHFLEQAIHNFFTFMFLMGVMI